MIPARDWVVIGLITAGCAVAAVVAGMLVLLALRRRPVSMHLFVATGAALLTAAGALLLTTDQMFISAHDASVALVVLVLSLPAGFAVSLVLGWQLRRSIHAIAAAAGQVGDAGYASAASTNVAELESAAAALDVTHRRLIESKAREQALEEGRRELVGWMSHDLRTPLAAMRAITESLEDGMVCDDDTLARYHHQLRVEVDRMAGMVSDLFELSRVQGPMRLHLERVGAHDLVADALASADPVARAKGVRLVAASGSGLPVAVDPTELGRVLRNLLVNAIRHTPDDGTVQVSAEAADGSVTLAVADACGGIPPEEISRVFETAYRGGNARTSSGDHGAGLGLAIARGIVEAHRGAISVVNAGGGCRFEVRLPLAAD